MDKKEETEVHFQQLYSDAFPRIYGFLMAEVGDPDLAEELTSETFFRAYQAWPPGKTGDVTLRAWLFRIARNLLIDHIRAVRRHPNVPLDDAMPALSGADPGEDDNLDRLAAREALAELSERDREIVSLRLAGLSNEEIAESLEISHGAARVAFSRAVQRLREILEVQDE